MNPLSAILLCPTSHLAGSDASKVIIKGVADEVASVIEAVGVNGGRISKRYVTSEGLYDAAITACTQSPGSYSSMAIDVKLGKPTEIEYFTGYVARRATEFGIPTPNCSILTELVLAKAAVMDRVRSQPKDTVYGSWQ